ncbi:MAG: AhpC/TSA family protein [Dehalococcoidia bacterium]|nr:MAG: AhpC/TSA family protein [Dehalococcoidia bacterium]
MENVESSAGPLTVLTPTGEAVRLGDVWRDRPVVLALIRHFGCQFCKDHVSRLVPAVPAIHEAGAELVIVGSGNPSMAGFFAEDYHVTTPLFTDPGREVYRALGAKRPTWTALLNPRLYWNALQVHRRGHRLSRVQGDLAQLGGVFIILPGGDVPFAYRSEVAGDVPGMARVLDELKRAARR